MPAKRQSPGNCRCNPSCAVFGATIPLRDLTVTFRTVAATMVRTGTTWDSGWFFNPNTPPSLPAVNNPPCYVPGILAGFPWSRFVITCSGGTAVIDVYLSTNGTTINYHGTSPTTVVNNGTLASPPAAFDLKIKMNGINCPGGIGIQSWPAEIT